VGSDGDVYIIFPTLKYLTPAVGDSGYEDALFHIYNYTDDVLYDPVELELFDTTAVDEISSVWLYYAPAIVRSEIVFSYELDFDSGVADTDRGFAFYCVNVETQVGQVAYQHSFVYNGNTFVPEDQWGMVSDRAYRRIYCILNSYTEPYVAADSEDTIFRYDLATNAITIESHHPYIDSIPAPYTDNLPLLIQNKEYAHKLTNLYCADTDAGTDKTNCGFLYPLFSRIEVINDTVLFDPPALEYWPRGKYDMDDVSGDLYTLNNEGVNPIIWVNRYESAIDIATITDASRLFLQGDHILIEETTTKVMWVVY